MVLSRLPNSWSNWNLEMFFEEREKPEKPVKSSCSKEENQQQTQPTYGVDVMIWTQAALVGDECSHHCATLAALWSKDAREGDLDKLGGAQEC